MSNENDKLNTNILRSKNPTVNIVQEMAVQVYVMSVTDDILQHTLKKGITGSLQNVLGKAAYESYSIPIKNSKILGKVIVSKETLLKFKNMFRQKATSKIGSMLTKSTPDTLKNITKIIATKVGTKTATIVSKSAAKSASTVASEAALDDLTIGALLCGTTGAETAGIGCAVGVAITVILLAFDVLNLLMSLLDTSGITVLMHHDTIDQLAIATGKAMASNFPNQPNYFDEEVFLDPHSFLFQFTESGDIEADPYWTAIYEGYRDEYMTSIGITGDWRSRLSSTPISLSTDNGVLSESTIRSIDSTNNLNSIVLASETPPLPTYNTPLIFFIICLILIVFLVFFYIFIL